MLKSWAFIYQGHPIRVEIWWRFTGWCRKRVYIDHQLSVIRIDRFNLTLPGGPDVHVRK